jgi:hypothetical protein
VYYVYVQSMYAQFFNDHALRRLRSNQSFNALIKATFLGGCEATNPSMQGHTLRKVAKQPILQCKATFQGS